MANSPDMSALASYGGTYDRKLIATMINGLDVVNDVTLRSNVKNKQNMTKLNVKKGIRPFTSTFDPLGDELEYSGRTLEVEKGKYELRIDPEKYRESWMSEVLSAGSGAGKKEIPFAPFVWAEVIKRVSQELNDETAGYGIGQADISAFNSGATYASGDVVSFGTPTQYYQANAATTAGESPTSAAAKWDNVNAKAVAKGLLTHVQEAVDASDISEVAIGVIDNSTINAYEAQLELFRAHDVPFKRAGVTQLQSYVDYELLLDDLRNTLKYSMADVQSMMAPGGGIYLPYTERKCIAKPASWIGTSRRIVSTMKENLIMGTDLLSDVNKIGTDEHIHTLDAAITFLLGFQIRDLGALRINDQE